jgi:hypothetical protein
MISNQKLSGRINQLISLADKTLSTKRESRATGASAYVDTELFNEFRTSSLSFIKNLYGEEHPYFTDFDNNVHRSSASLAERGRGILKAIKSEIDGGWLISMKGLVSAEIFSDFLEMSEYLLKEGYKDPAAVIMGSVLEEHLRQLCNNHQIDITYPKGADKIPKKAEAMNSDLAKAGIYNLMIQKSVTAWLDIRNNAAHGKYNEYKIENVNLMYQGILNFVSTHS